MKLAHQEGVQDLTLTFKRLVVMIGLFCFIPNSCMLNIMSVMYKNLSII
jgi:hypothetical protein